LLPFPCRELADLFPSRVIRFLFVLFSVKVFRLRVRKIVFVKLKSLPRRGGFNYVGERLCKQRLNCRTPPFFQVRSPFILFLNGFLLVRWVDPLCVPPFKFASAFRGPPPSLVGFSGPPWRLDSAPFTPTLLSAHRFFFSLPFR